MKIVHIVCRYPPYYGGMGNTTYAMASRLVDRDLTVEVLTPQYDHPTKEEIAHVKRLTPSMSYGNGAIIPNLEKELTDTDIVHLHYPFFGVANTVRKWRLRNKDKRLVVTYHMDNRGAGIFGLYFRFYAKMWLPKILAAADLVIGSSFDYIQASDAKAHLAAHPQQWKELPFGVDQTRFHPDHTQKELVCEVHNLNPNLPVVGFVGGMDSAHYFKGVKELIEAIAVLKHTKQLPVQALLVGDGNLRAEFEQLAAQLGVSDMIAFAGFVTDDDLPRYYQAFDVFTLPSTSVGEAFGTVLLEAMASGVPVIASDLPGVRTVAMHAGWVVPPRNATALADAIESYVELPAEKRTFFAQKARAAVETHYSWEKVVDELVAIYGQVKA